MRVALAGAPRLGQQLLDRRLLCRGQVNQRIHIFRIYLKNKFPTSAAGRQNSFLVRDSDDLLYRRFAMLQHFRNRGMFGAKTETARRIDADTRKNIPFAGDERRPHAAATRQSAQLSVPADLQRFPMQPLKIIFHR